MVREAVQAVVRGAAQAVGLAKEEGTQLKTKQTCQELFVSTQLSVVSLKTLPMGITLSPLMLNALRTDLYARI